MSSRFLSLTAALAYSPIIVTRDALLRQWHDSQVPPKVYVMSMIQGESFTDSRLHSGPDSPLVPNHDDCLRSIRPRG